ncbi:MAG: T9SS type A sorting domain-containing protein [Bacteroidetes bacterium]|nr:T9SS type A sorting domain-containing protein [Bacteroidota bacterium]
MRNLILALTLFFSGLSTLQATHIVGGEMNYTCLGNNQYEITLTIFRDCFNGNPAAFFDNPASIGIFSGATNNLIDAISIPFDPMVNDTLDPVLSSNCLVVPPNVCVHTTTYTAVVNLPTIPGGYILSYQRCCRNVTISNIVGPLDTGATYSTFISEDALQECNSNAKFNTWPPIYICVNEPINFDHSATDSDGDSLVYKLCTPLEGANPSIPQPVPPNPPPYNEITWIDPPYNETNMLNGTPGGAPLTIDPETGLLEGLPNTIGQFVVGVCVEEYRDGQLISTTRRDFQYNVGVCGETTSAFAHSENECNELTVSFFNNSINADEFIWDFGDPTNPGPNSFLENPEYTFPEPGIYTVTLIVEPNSVCEDTFSTQVDLSINALEATDLKVCSNELFDLEYTSSGDPSGISWTNSDGDVINPMGISIQHDDCEPGVYEYIVSGICPDDSTTLLTDTAYITVITDDITPFFDVIEEPCLVDVVLDSACAEYIQVLGDIPVINPGDSGSVTVEVLQTTKMTCTSEEVTLDFNCACSIGDLIIETGECMDGFFMVTLDFEFENTTGQFQVLDQDGNDLGIFDYTDLPVEVGPFLGDPSLLYSLEVMDTQLPDCISTLEFEPVECVVACDASTNSPVCEGDTLELFEAGGDAVSWEWFSDGSAVFDDASLQNPTATNVSDGEVFSVVVTSASGLSDTCMTVASVFQAPVCSIEAATAICQGEPLPLTENGGDAVSWIWSSDGGASFDDTNIQSPTATSLTDGETISVEITDANGCTSICTFTITVFDIPACNAETDGPICIGEDLLLFETGGDAVSWTWSTDGGASIDDTGAQNPTASNVSDGETFTVEITDENGCTSSCELTAVVNDLPDCNAETDGPICAGSPLSLTENGGDAVSWQWSSDGGAVIDDVNAQNPTATEVSDGETFTVEVTDANGCVSSCEVTAVVFPLPNCEAGNDGPVCDGQPLPLFESGGDAVSWLWTSDGDAVLDDATAQNPMAENVSQGEIFTVEVTDENGCISSCSTTAEIFDQPDLDAINNGPICEGDILILEAEVAGGTEPYNYNWSHVNGFNSDNETVYIQGTSQLDAGTYELEITDANGCGAESSTEVVITSNLTSPGVIAADEYFCGPGYDPAPIYEISPVMGAIGPVTYFWMKKEGDGQWEVIPGATGLTYDPGPIYITTEFARCVVMDGCLVALESNTVIKAVGNEVDANPIGPASICLDEEGFYMVLPTPGATYEWDFGPNATPASSNNYWANVSFSSTGIQTITLTVSTPGCTASNFMQVYVSNSPVNCDPGIQSPSTEGINGEGVFKEHKMLVYPNPFDEVVHIRLEQILDNPGLIKLSDVNGRVLQMRTLESGEISLSLEMMDVPSGVYFISLEVPGWPVYHQRVIRR